MWDKDKAILLTNNDKVFNKYHNEMSVEMLASYEDVLIRTRDYVHKHYIILTHPQAGSLKPNQTPCRSIIVYPEDKEGNLDSLMLIEKCIEVYYAWQEIAPTPRTWVGNALEDFKTIDLSIVDNVMPRLS